VESIPYLLPLIPFASLTFDKNFLWPIFPISLFNLNLFALQDTHDPFYRTFIRGRFMDTILVS